MTEGKNSTDNANPDKEVEPEAEGSEPLESAESQDQPSAMATTGALSGTSTEEAVDLEPPLSEPESDQTEIEIGAELEELRLQAEEYLQGWQRARAEFANYKKRVEKEMQEAYQRAAGDILARYLFIMDDLERALKERPEGSEASAWADGVELIYRKFENILESQGVEPVPAIGEMFDPNLHEAISHEDSDSHRAGEVIDVIQRGYAMGDRILRPALVRVAK